MQIVGLFVLLRHSFTAGTRVVKNTSLFCCRSYSLLSPSPLTPNTAMMATSLLSLSLSESFSLYVAGRGLAHVSKQRGGGRRKY
jgi:hypothetical protein